MSYTQPQPRTTEDAKVNLLAPGGKVHATHRTSLKRTACMHIYNKRTWDQTTKRVSCVNCIVAVQAWREN